jgi:hypothetical protein
VSFCLVSFLIIFTTAEILGHFFYHGKSYAVILTKSGLGYILGDYLTNSSGHPDCHVFP